MIGIIMITKPIIEKVRIDQGGKIDAPLVSDTQALQILHFLVEVSVPQQPNPRPKTDEVKKVMDRSFLTSSPETEAEAGPHLRGNRYYGHRSL